MLSAYDGKKEYVPRAEKHGGSVCFGGNNKGKIIGTWTIGNSSLPSTTNVLLVEGLMHNILSISQLSDNDYDIIFNQKSWKVVSQKNDFILFSGKRKNNIYKIKLSDEKKESKMPYVSERRIMNLA